MLLYKNKLYIEFSILNLLFKCVSDSVGCLINFILNLVNAHNQLDYYIVI